MIKTAVFSSLFGLFFVLGLAGSAVYFGGDHVAATRTDAVIVSLSNIGKPNSATEPVVIALAPPDPRRLETVNNDELSVAETAEFSPAAGPAPEAPDDVMHVSNQPAPPSDSEPIRTEVTKQIEAGPSPSPSSEAPPSPTADMSLGENRPVLKPESASPDGAELTEDSGAPSLEGDSVDLASVVVATPNQSEATVVSPLVSPDVAPVGDATVAEPSEPRAIPLPAKEVSEAVVVVRRSNLRQSPTVNAPIMGKLIVGDRAVQKTEKPVEGYHRVIASDTEGWIWFLNIEPATSDPGATVGSDESIGEARNVGEVAE